MSYNIALQFEDGVSRIIPAKPTNWSATRLPRQDQHPAGLSRRRLRHLQVPLRERQLRDGVHIDDALTEDEAAEGYVLTCQMKPTSDCVVRVPASSAACKTEVGTYGGKMAKIDRDSPTTVSFTLKSETPVTFLPGQYVNLQVPGTKGNALVLVQLDARPDRVVLSHPRRARRPDEHLHATEGGGRRLHDVQRSLWQLLPSAGWSVRS